MRSNCWAFSMASSSDWGHSDAMSFAMGVIAQNDTSLPVTTFPRFRHISALHESHWKSLEKHLYWRTHILSSVTPFDLISAPLEIYFSQLKLSRRHQSLKIPRNTLKMHFFCVFTTLLICKSRIIRESRVLQVANSYIRRLLLCKLTDHSRVVLLHSHE